MTAKEMKVIIAEQGSLLKKFYV